MLEMLLLNKRAIGEFIGLALICFVAWWFFIHNPATIKALEADKSELSRQVESGKKAVLLLGDIEKGKAKINETTFKQISSIRAAAIPRRAVLIVGGVPLPTVH